MSNHINMILRVAAKVVIEAENGVLALHPSDIDLNRKYHFPGGIRDDINEPLTITAIREVMEETGVEIDPRSLRTFKIGEWTAIDKGENVKILAVFFHVALPSRPIVKLSTEHDGSVWLDKSNYHDFDANPEVYEIIDQLL